MARMRNSLLVLALALTACPAEKTEPKPVAATPPPAAPAARARKVTLLVTGHESGLLPLKAPRLAAQWKAEEHWPDTLAFSTGDSFAGEPISAHFLGASTAEVMKALQYKASALGNHDLDLGLDTLRTFRESSGVTMLAANLKDKADSDQPLKLAASTVVTREGVKVGVIGFTSVKTVATTVAGRASGLEVTELEASVGAAMKSLEKDAPDVVLALSDDCFVTLQKALATHAEWKIDLVVGTRCEGDQEFLSGPTKFFSVGDDLTHYVSAAFELKADGTKSLNASRKTVATTGAEDADLLALRERWQKKLDEELGQTICFTKTGFKEDAPQLRTLVANALMDGAKADAALLNKKGIRAALPKGPITAASVYSIIPFDNAVVTVKVKGEVITKLKTHPEAFMVAPAKVDPDKDYVLATTEYIYFGGDGLGLDVVAPELELTGQVWQTPVIAWLSKQGCNEQKPLEKIVK
jgi:2',3'-cyclic-nucleotide 2'-phosphodiesterase (5'-nucleotidase family)